MTGGEAADNTFPDEWLDAKTYYTHNNGGRPYMVVVTSDGVHVYDNLTGSTLYVFDDPERVFVGESPKTRITVFSQGYGPEFDSNSILVHIKGCEYAYIGSKFHLFETDSPIVKYVSEVGNNDVPYPYAVDERGRFYLMVENVVLNKLDPSETDPYGAFYQIPNTKYAELLGYTHIVGSLNPDELYVHSYTSNPRTQYYYPWMKDLEGVKPDGSREPISEEEFVAIHDKIAKHFGFTDLVPTRTIAN
tara:strand:+ start:2205 stop:2945 length:741 start_codon:yes stop_codon:yes gene_type:complete